ncbi:MAG TPA: biotin--[acetyl-CoA-carboxylase] ligase [Gammaproteobacteria bacterium]|nr:biotin--[acetyl-CoA-carboxylase] ligase [Gammaproteobacteria bacterium]
MPHSLLLSCLADGRFHSGEKLAQRLGVSRSAIWKQVQKLTALGVAIHRVPGRGYRLAQTLELLDADAIRAALAPQWQDRLTLLTTFSVPSTNSHLTAVPDQQWPVACLAEHQSAGRGRRGRDWQSPLGGNLYLSLGWRFDNLPPDFAALGLAVGVVMAQALKSLGVADVGLKWPNDIVARQAKLGGILIELAGEPAGPCRVVIGLGLNLRLPAAINTGQAAIDLATLLAEPPSRNAMAGLLLTHMCELLTQYPQKGFSHWQAAWRQYDVLSNNTVRIEAPAHAGGWLEGTALGVAKDGALRLATADGERRFYSGDVSVRKVG